MEIIKNGQRAAIKGPEDWFTGTVRVDMLFDAHAPAITNGALVTFEPGARTAWHTHPLGQTLIITAGSGFVQLDGQKAQAVQPGDVVWIAPGERHWHGAAPTTAMSHIAVQEALKGSTVTWQEQVSDSQYVR